MTERTTEAKLHYGLFDEAATEEKTAGHKSAARIITEMKQNGEAEEAEARIFGDDLAKIWNANRQKYSGSEVLLYAMQDAFFLGYHRGSQAEKNRRKAATPGTARSARSGKKTAGAGR